MSEPTEMFVSTVMVEKPSVAIVMPAGNTMPTPAAVALAGLARRLPPGSNMLVEGSVDVAGKRNQLTRMALGLGMKWILFLDSDMAAPDTLVDRLLKREVPAVGALYFHRHYPFTAATNPQLRPGEGLVEVDAIGTGALLVHRGVFENLEPPWFHRTVSSGGDEDGFFCRKARAAGLKIYCDTDIVVPHVGPITIDAKVAARLRGDTDFLKFCGQFGPAWKTERCGGLVDGSADRVGPAPKRCALGETNRSLDTPGVRRLNSGKEDE